MKGKLLWFVVFGIVFLSGCRGSGESVQYEDVHLGGSELHYYNNVFSPQSSGLPRTPPPYYYKIYPSGTIKKKYEVTSWSCTFACIHSWFLWISKRKNVTRSHLRDSLVMNYNYMKQHLSIEKIMNKSIYSSQDKVDNACFDGQPLADSNYMLKTLLKAYSSNELDLETKAHFPFLKNLFKKDIYTSIKVKNQPVMIGVQRMNNEIGSSHSIMISGFKINNNYPDDSDHIESVYYNNGAIGWPEHQFVEVNTLSDDWKLGAYIIVK